MALFTLTRGKRIFVAIVALIAITTPTATASSSQCLLEHEGVSYDLRSVERTGVFIAQGGNIPYTEGDETEFNYFFGLCENVQLSRVPKEFNVKQCKELGAAAVYQSSLDGTVCKRAGSISHDLSLLDVNNPTRGFSILYQNGDVCNHKHDGSECTGTECPQRETRVDFECAKTGDEDREPSVYEVNADGKPSICQYKVTYKTLLACPLECGKALFNGEMSLCGGRGICGFDRSNNRARCFCDDGWSGSACAVSGSSANGGSSGSSVLMWLLFFLMIGLVVLVVLMSKQIRAYRDDAQVYLQVRGDEMMQQMRTI